MKKSLLFVSALFLAGAASAQEHYAGINTSKRVGILNTAINPAEFVNLSNDYEINLITFSANVANNKISFKDIVDGKDFDNLIFEGNEPTNLRVDVEILGPSFAMKMNKWAFGITSAAKIKADMVEVNPALGRAVTNSGVDDIIELYDINSQYNQRGSATTWGEIGFSVARELYNSENHRLSGGVTFKLLFPGSYANIALNQFEGTIENVAGDVSLTNASAMVNIAYSGSLAEDFTDSSNFSQFFAGGLNGFGTDIGINYQWKDVEKGGYKLNTGLAVRNIGSMKFKDDNNVSNNYNLEITGAESLNLNQFEDVSDLKEIEQILIESGYVTIDDSKRDFKVKLPTVFSAYADVKLYNKWFVTAYTQQKVNEDSDNEQIAIQNILTVTPRYSTNFFEAYVPLSHNEISGFTAGVGLRIGGFFIGSGSILSAALSETDQADAYLGFRFGF
ncbi:DUF5723 family protein [Flavobacterium sp. MK4S-17]|uniref:DUF5723 family protein n=1 Tax=Flavobacterium sp. MK4S-17 TaxID=2543737 RepID=UPI00135C3B2C|nr:DUF5723 family protein [Flavobacterium sp. MK4S-17]